MEQKQACLVYSMETRNHMVARNHRVANNQDLLRPVIVMEDATLLGDAGSLGSTYAKLRAVNELGHGKVGDL